MAAVALLLALTAVGSPSPGLAASPAPLEARLHVSNLHPRQDHGVLLDASASSGPVAGYVFHYGDGVVESTYQPLAMHGYRNPGAYRATVVVFDHFGRQASSKPVTIRVRDGIPPVVRIDSPRPGQRVHFRPSGILIKGRASDAGGVKRVDLALQLVALAHHRAHVVASKCIWFDGHKLVSSSCTVPLFFRATLAGKHWRFHINPRSRFFAGTYVVRVRAIDRSGNASHFYAVRLRTILPFELVA